MASLFLFCLVRVLLPFAHAQSSLRSASLWDLTILPRCGFILLFYVSYLKLTTSLNRLCKELLSSSAPTWRRSRTRSRRSKLVTSSKDNAHIKLDRDGCGLSNLQGKGTGKDWRNWLETRAYLGPDCTFGRRRARVVIDVCTLFSFKKHHSFVFFLRAR